MGTTLTDAPNNVLAKRCIDELAGRLEADFELVDVHPASFPAGDHAVSIPLKMKGRVHNHHHALLSKLVTQDGVRAHREVISKKNNRFQMHGIYDIWYEEFDNPYDLLRCEVRFLKASHAAGIHVPSFYGIYQLPTCTALVLEFVHGVPFERSHFKKNDLFNIFSVIKQLRENRLIHGDLRRDNFLLTTGGDVYLVDYLPLMGSVERALDYDLMSAICHLSLSADPLDVFKAARSFFPPAALKGGLPFLGFITERLPDQERALLERTISTV